MARYDIDKFDPPPDPDLVCCICHCVLDSPVESPCRHVFCRVCIETWLANHHNCPTCRRRLRIHSLKPVLPLVQNMINNLLMFCDFRENGCLEKIMLELFDGHVKDCDFAKLTCRFSRCSREILRKDLKEHEDEMCEFREKKCTRQCGLMIPVSILESHNCVEELQKFATDSNSLVEKLKKSVEELTEMSKTMKKNMDDLTRELQRRRELAVTSSPDTSSSDSFWSMYGGYTSPEYSPSRSSSPSYIVNSPEYSVNSPVNANSSSYSANVLDSEEFNHTSNINNNSDNFNNVNNMLEGNRSVRFVIERMLNTHTALANNNVVETLDVDEPQDISRDNSSVDGTSVEPLPSTNLNIAIAVAIATEESGLLDSSVSADRYNTSNGEQHSSSNDHSDVDLDHNRDSNHEDSHMTPIHSPSSSNGFYEHSGGFSENTDLSDNDSYISSIRSIFCDHNQQQEQQRTPINIDTSSNDSSIQYMGENYLNASNSVYSGDENDRFSEIYGQVSNISSGGFTTDSTSVCSVDNNDHFSNISGQASNNSFEGFTTDNNSCHSFRSTSVVSDRSAEGYRQSGFSEFESDRNSSPSRSCLNNITRRSSSSTSSYSDNTLQYNDAFSNNSDNYSDGSLSAGRHEHLSDSLLSESDNNTSRKEVRENPDTHFPNIGRNCEKDDKDSEQGSVSDIAKMIENVGNSVNTSSFLITNVLAESRRQHQNSRQEHQDSRWQHQNSRQQHQDGRRQHQVGRQQHQDSRRQHQDSSVMATVDKTVINSGSNNTNVNQSCTNVSQDSSVISKTLDAKDNRENSVVTEEQNQEVTECDEQESLNSDSGRGTCTPSPRTSSFASINLKLNQLEDLFRQRGKRKLNHESTSFPDRKRQKDSNSKSSLREQEVNKHKRRHTLSENPAYSCQTSVSSKKRKLGHSPSATVTSETLAADSTINTNIGKSGSGTAQHVAVNNTQSTDKITQQQMRKSARSSHKVTETRTNEESVGTNESDVAINVIPQPVSLFHLDGYHSDSDESWLPMYSESSSSDASGEDWSEVIDDLGGSSDDESDGHYVVHVPPSTAELLERFAEEGDSSDGSWTPCH